MGSSGISRGYVKWFIFGIILKLELVRFIDGLDVGWERKRRVEDDFKVLFWGFGGMKLLFIERIRFGSGV